MACGLLYQWQTDWSVFKVAVTLKAKLRYVGQGVSALFMFIMLFLASPSAFSQSDNLGEFITLSNGREHFVRYHPAEFRLPTIVILPGLTSNADDYRVVFDALQKWGFGVLVVDMLGQGRTIAKQINFGTLKTPADVGPISPQDQVEDVRLILDQLKVPHRFFIFGHSYGGAIGELFASLFPERVINVASGDGYFEPLEPQHTIINTERLGYRLAELMGYGLLMPTRRHLTDDEVYDRYLEQFSNLSYVTEPGLLEHVTPEDNAVRIKLKAIFRMTQAIRHLNVKELLPRLPKNSLSIIQSEYDQYQNGSLLATLGIVLPPGLEGVNVVTGQKVTEVGGQTGSEDLWLNVPPHVRYGRFIFHGAEHDLPGVAPHSLAALLAMIMLNDSRIGGGRTFEADPVTGNVFEITPKGRGKKTLFHLPKDKNAACPWWLRRMEQMTTYQEHIPHLPSPALVMP